MPQRSVTQARLVFGLAITEIVANLAYLAWVIQPISSLLVVSSLLLIGIVGFYFLEPSAKSLGIMEFAVVLNSLALIICGLAYAPWSKVAAWPLASNTHVVASAIICVIAAMLAASGLHELENRGLNRGI